eukprot:17743-Pelagococcus_subviridis.AAC.2
MRRGGARVSRGKDRRRGGGGARVDPAGIKIAASRSSITRRSRWRTVQIDGGPDGDAASRARLGRAARARAGRGHAADGGGMRGDGRHYGVRGVGGGRRTRGSVCARCVPSRARRERRIARRLSSRDVRLYTSTPLFSRTRRI